MDIPAVFLNGCVGIHKFQLIIFPGFIPVQVLGNNRFLRVTKKIVVVLDEDFRRIAVAPLDPVNQSVFPDRLRDYNKNFP